MARQDDKDSVILEEAMDWFLRLREEPRHPAVEAEFARWLQQSAAHAEAWQKACRTWGVLGDVTPVHAASWQSHNIAAFSPPPSRRRGRWMAAGVALAACLVLALAGPALLIRLQADYMTATAETRRVTLEDGTVVDMGADSAIKVEIAGSSRHVTLLHGGAFFDVAHDAARPFTVDAGGVEVAVLGTAFDVQLSSDETTVELARGIVSLSPEPAAGRAVELAPGEMAVVDHDSGAVVKGTIAVEDIASWRNGRLFVNDVTIASVVEQLQRYHPAWIKVANRKLASRRVTGLYDLGNPDRALHALVEPYGGKVHALSPYLRVLADF